LTFDKNCKSPIQNVIRAEKNQNLGSVSTVPSGIFYFSIPSGKRWAQSKAIHPKYYKHFKKGAHQSHLGRQKWASFWQIKTEILNKIGI
jgi:hypothetical protein